MNVVSNELLGGIVYKSSAHKVWTDLKDKFDKVDRSRIFYLHKDIATLSQGISSVSAYFSKLIDFWEEYDALILCPGCDCPESKSYFEHFEYQRLLQFLIGLNEIYSQPRSHILMMSPAPSVNKAYSMVVSEESQRALGKFSQSVDIGDGTALFTNRGTNSRNNYKPRRGNLFCDYCNYKGHTRDNYFKLHGYPTDFKTRKKAKGFPKKSMANATTHEEQQAITKQFTTTTSEEGQQVMSASTAISAQGMPITFTQEQYDQILKLINKDTSENSGFAGTTKTFITNEIVNSENWIVDSSVTNHMVHTRELLDKINTEILDNIPKIMQDLHSGKVKEIGKELERLYKLQHQKLKAKAANVQIQDHSVQEEDLRICLMECFIRILVFTQQNGVVERKQRHILEVARAIRLQCFLPLKVWGEYVQAIVYVINRLPLSVLSGKSSFEVVYGRVPSLQYMRTIGCLCFAKLVGEGDMFAARSIGVVLMGDVKFMEHVFPLQLLKEGKLQLFPNGVLDFPVTDDAEMQIASTHSLSLEYIQHQQPISLKQETSNYDGHQLRKLTRTTKEPVWMKDYICNGSLMRSEGKQVCKYPMQNYLTHTILSTKFQAYLSKITSTREPMNYDATASDSK
ncbi:uncharacterized protein [Nicotiana sylvestris]|uniref:uncharacterized protein n=1 Tax=Nicotiana sylvestris TaxID=4096 RepID=UPI00388C7DF7